MRGFFSLFADSDQYSEDSIIAGTESLNSIRNKIIDAVYLVGAIIGTFALYGIIMRTIYKGWQKENSFQILIFVINWTVFLLRYRIPLNWKAFIFFIILFIGNTILNYTAGIISGAMQYLIVTVLVALLFGWKLSVLTILLALLIRAIIGWLYYKGFLINQVDLNKYSTSPDALITSIVGWLFTTAIIVYSINKFHKWLQLSLHSLTLKTSELVDINKELLKAKQKAEENDRLKSVFLANMSHEIRTPMNAIIGFSDLLAKRNITEERKLRYITLIQERSYDLLRIIQDILDISKIEVGQMEIVEAETNLNSLLTEIYDYYKLKVAHSLDKKELEIRYYLAENISDLIIQIDHQRLKQVLNNLIDNALKFTHNGIIEFGCEKHTANELMFFVKDTGIGISKDKYDIVFERFGQADNALGARQYGGTGLGLSIVKGILQLMDGEIWFNSEVNEGTTFYFTLPIKKPISPIKSPKYLDSVDTSDWNCKSVLIVEDDEANNEFLSDLLLEQGLKIYKAFSGKETKEVFALNHDIDIVLLDVRLTDISGLELVNRMKTERPEVIIIAQTAYAGEGSKADCINAGCDDFIAKPIKAEQLLPLISKYLNK